MAQAFVGARMSETCPGAVNDAFGLFGTRPRSAARGPGATTRSHTLADTCQCLVLFSVAAILMGRIRVPWRLDSDFPCTVGPLFTGLSAPVTPSLEKRLFRALAHVCLGLFINDSRTSVTSNIS